MAAFGELLIQKNVTNQLFGLEFCVVQQDTIFPFHQDYKQVNFLEKVRFYSFGLSGKGFGAGGFTTFLGLDAN